MSSQQRTHQAALSLARVAWQITSLSLMAALLRRDRRVLILRQL